MRKVILFILLVFCASIGFAQSPTKTKIDSVPAPEPKNWKHTVATQIGFSQLSLNNWAAGGYGSISLNTFLNMNANYSKDNFIWDNQLQIGYGFIRSFDDGYKKSDDRFIFDSKLGYKAVDNLYFSAVYNFKTQFAEGYEKSVLVSNFFAPAYTSLGIGMDYKPKNNIAINVAPITGKIVMVSDENLRVKYGNAIDKFCKFELGAQIKIDTKLAVENFQASSSLTLFSDYLNKPQNIKVNWDVNIDAKITKFFSATMRTYMIYDDTIKFLDKKDNIGNVVLNDAGEVIKVPGIQFKEIFSIGFSYTFFSKK